MHRFDNYRDGFPNARLTRSESGVLEAALHTNGGTLVFDGHTHEQFVDLFHAIGSDPDNRVVILTGSGDAFMELIAPDGFDFFTPRGYRRTPDFDAMKRLPDERYAHSTDDIPHADPLSPSSSDGVTETIIL